MSSGIDLYLNNIASKIYSNQNLCKLLYYNTTLDPINQSNLPTPSIIYTDKENQSLFFTPFNFQIEQDSRVRLYVEVNNFKPSDNIYFKRFSINFVVCVSNNLWDIQDGSGEIKLRPHMIIDELNTLFNKASNVGIGKNFIQSAQKIPFSDWHSGYIYTISAQDFTMN